MAVTSLEDVPEPSNNKTGGVVLLPVGDGVFTTGGGVLVCAGFCWADQLEDPHPVEIRNTIVAAEIVKPRTAGTE